MKTQLAGSGNLAGGKDWIEIAVRGESWPKIEKVPQMLREVTANTGCYDPIVASIGPYQHGKPVLDFMRQHKKAMAGQYASAELNQKVRTLVKDAKECYTETEAVDKFSDEEFIQMMALDACFIVEFIDCIVNERPEALKMKSNMIAFVQRDLLLLENQIPFKFLHEILGVKFGDENKMEMLHSFQQDGSDKAKAKATPFNGEPAHPLDVMRSNLVDKFAWTNNPQLKGKGRGSYWFSYRSAKELRAAGIHFRLSKTNKFTDVEFLTSIFYSRAYLKLPQICIDDSTKSMLLNMIANESSTNGPSDFGVCSYICFMGSLVDHAEDVVVLRKKVVKEGIEEHYKNCIKIWLADFWHTNFTSPWTVLAFIGAILALFLSVIQTHESIKPSNC
ncbi:UPF0481 protein At3g47200-like [Mangifera indica]|uniref:UPF0481 protein At3g47200-like n=1 Tax=Mangifera indica TaxID=29780 RepID=UPI001CFC2953|nr:UPF0481 protein At3g47200-like [Mangifera indica]